MKNSYINYAFFLFNSRNFMLCESFLIISAFVSSSVMYFFIEVKKGLLCIGYVFKFLDKKMRSNIFPDQSVRINFKAFGEKYI